MKRDIDSTKRVLRHGLTYERNQFTVELPIAR